MKTSPIRILVIATVFLYAAGAAAQTLDRDAFIAVNKKVSPSVVRIHVKGKRPNSVIGDGLKGAGSGFVVTEGRIVTNHHVIRGGGNRYYR